MIPSILRNYSLFVDGRGYAGKVIECNLPKLTLKTEEYLAGGMDAPIDMDMGMEAMNTDYSLAQYNPDILKLFGLSDASGKAITMRGAEQDENGNVIPIIAQMRGFHKEADFGGWKKPDKASLKMTANLRYYRLTVGGDLIYEIDLTRMTRFIGDKDQLSDQRDALGIN